MVEGSWRQEFCRQLVARADDFARRLLLVQLRIVGDQVQFMRSEADISRAIVSRTIYHDALLYLS
jgi:hypothetical protein